MLNSVSISHQHLCIVWSDMKSGDKTERSWCPRPHALNTSSFMHMEKVPFIPFYIHDPTISTLHAVTTQTGLCSLQLWEIFLGGSSWLSVPGSFFFFLKRPLCRFCSQALLQNEVTFHQWLRLRLFLSCTNSLIEKCQLIKFTWTASRFAVWLRPKGNTALKQHQQG